MHVHKPVISFQAPPLWVGMCDMSIQGRPLDIVSRMSDAEETA